MMTSIGEELQATTGETSIHKNFFICQGKSEYSASMVVSNH
jgi:hypothetical protein